MVAGPGEAVVVVAGSCVAGGFSHFLRDSRNIVVCASNESAVLKLLPSGSSPSSGFSMISASRPGDVGARAGGGEARLAAVLEAAR